jgi:hypothetical protein
MIKDELYCKYFKIRGGGGITVMIECRRDGGAIKRKIGELHKISSYLSRLGFFNISCRS